jgi:phage virion morphogenesis protein
MASSTIRIEDAPIRAALAALSTRLGNMQDVMDNIGSRLIGLAQGGFTRGQSPDGTPWKPLAASTILARQKRGKWPGSTLRVSGGLFGSLNWKAAATSVEIGAGWGDSGAYAAIHQFGGQAGRGRKVTIPARPYLPMSPLPDPYLRSCLDIINQSLGEAING